LIAFFVSQVFNGALQELVVREVDLTWLRMAVGVAVPCAVATWFWRSGRCNRCANRLQSLATVAGRPAVVVAAAAVIALLQLMIGALSLETLVAVWGESVRLQINVPRNWVLGLVWPAFVLGFLLWQMRQCAHLKSEFQFKQR